MVYLCAYSGCPRKEAVNQHKGPFGLVQVAVYNSAYMVQCQNYVKLALQYFSI